VPDEPPPVEPEPEPEEGGVVVVVGGVEPELPLEAVVPPVFVPVVEPGVVVPGVVVPGDVVPGVVVPPEEPVPAPEPVLLGTSQGLPKIAAKTCGTVAPCLIRLVAFEMMSPSLTSLPWLLSCS
jgi:hypothetical protein